ncbi:DNA-directed DNA polymerase [Elasticomyces elasticus]|uniref:DNA-directed DNA polymerase n=1 Tax=Exophiala sideris TaxID=1016849 RepID=A0ABR0J7P5_9EURO|nr:DNA-directed DNA polymerase [Elasticomyces elasticus]KAK5029957.1 DNA-directed DNA polymerase [Exophiala sideris]KAK5031603.1 DNA-directed DNA polymerase [Exophiala sideris]KAK5058281.1 DNA-directed DNA polymerase [Exophiala sideris]KAK5180210.1 DNA-directed DNA polymerase [Eurotiomycetes sp. CCFEE 6388]
MSKKRKREVDIELVQVYEQLADEDETTRLKAAHTLVSKIFKPGVTSDEQTRTILTRLFRGLCSGRKAARLGFSVALTELLSQLSTEPSVGEELSASAIIDILESQTVAEGGTSRQDERDHYFGRVFAADAVLKSGMLFQKPHQDQWLRVLNLLCALAIKKPWLRQECGWLLATCIASSSGEIAQAFAVDAIETLSTNKLIRTPEGVAIWLTTVRVFPHAKLPKSTWKHGDPLARKDVALLADILKDARTQPEADPDSEAQGSARWSANLHFAWDVVLGELIRDFPTTVDGDKNGTNGTKKNERITFEMFWKKVVDESLFSSASSSERKAWGFALWKKTLETAPRELLQSTFTPQATSCLVNSLKSSERHLQRHALKVSQAFPTRFAATDTDVPSQGFTGACIRALLQSVSYGDFDLITKSKTMQSLVDANDEGVLMAIASALASLATETTPEEDEKQLLTRQKTLINLQYKVVTASLRNAEHDEPSGNSERAVTARSIMKVWVQDASTSTHPESLKTVKAHFAPKLMGDAREFMKERLTLGFEQALRLGAYGCRILRDTVLEIHSMEKQHKLTSIMFEEDVGHLVRQAWQRLKSFSLSFDAASKMSSTKSGSGKAVKDSVSALEEGSFPTHVDGLCLLFCLVLFQIYTGEHDAVEILQDLLDSQASWTDGKEKKAVDEQEGEPADAMMEIILSFASRPSKFLKRITVQIFDAFAPHVTRTGLESLSRILAAKENAQGQQEMFQADDVDMQDGEDASTDEEEDSLGSDVEVESIADDASDSEDAKSASSSDEDDSGDEDETGDEDEELAAFDAALASALGTRRLDQNDVAADGESESSSDADMDDDEMLELDSKLAEVFRGRSEQSSKNKKKEAKDAKENVVNFKNRVLDLMESYLKHQQQNPLCIHLILPLLRLVRTTQTKQLSDRGFNTLQQYWGRCKGSNVPTLSTESEAQEATDILQSIHEEACMESSSVHSTATSHTSILLVKTLVESDAANIGSIVEIYAATRLRQLTDHKCRVLPGFFTDWNNWCQTARGKLAG